MQTKDQLTKLENLNKQIRISDVISVLMAQSTNLIDIVNKIDESKLSQIKLSKFIQKVNDSNAIISIFLNRDEKERLPEWEEIAAVSMSVQNMWLTCYANNIGSYWSTPSFLKEYGELIDLSVNQTSLGFFFMGVYDHKESPKLRDDITTKVEWI